MIPGTSFLANIVLSLRDKSYSPIETPRIILSAYGVSTLGQESFARILPWVTSFKSLKCDAICNGQKMTSLAGLH
jgi:hypothetical protein